MPHILDRTVEDYFNSINELNFDEIALEVYKYQLGNNSLYKSYADLLGVDASLNDTSSIPFLPISFFKTHKVSIDEASEHQQCFESSGTTGSQVSKHWVLDNSVYDRSILEGFQQFYGNPKDYTILALLPSYLERGNSSLVYMAKKLMDTSRHENNGFYLDEYSQLSRIIRRLGQQRQKVLLIGVTFALLDFADKYPMDMNHVTVLETGGMKGRGKELTREEVHLKLTNSWGMETIHSEYGMTELLSQAYSKGNGIYYPSKTMKVLVREISDPLSVSSTGMGVLNIIDLSNINSCSFIATEDLGRVYSDGSFEVLGRLDHTALRGCNLMVV